MARPPAVRFDPFGTSRYGFWKWQVENADLLPLRASAANCNDLFRRGEIHAFDGNRYTEYLRFEWQSEVVSDHRGKSHPLFVFIVRVHSGFADQCLELRPARWPASERCLDAPRQCRARRVFVVSEA